MFQNVTCPRLGRGHLAAARAGPDQIRRKQSRFIFRTASIWSGKNPEQFERVNLPPIIISIIYLQYASVRTNEVLNRSCIQKYFLSDSPVNVTGAPDYPVFILPPTVLASSLKMRHSLDNNHYQGGLGQSARGLHQDRLPAPRVPRQGPVQLSPRDRPPHPAPVLHQCRPQIRTGTFSSAFVKQKVLLFFDTLWSVPFAMYFLPRFRCDCFQLCMTRTLVEVQLQNYLIHSSTRWIPHHNHRFSPYRVLDLRSSLTGDLKTGSGATSRRPSQK